MGLLRMEPVAKTPGAEEERGSKGWVVEIRSRSGPDQAAWALKPAE